MPTRTFDISSNFPSPMTLRDRILNVVLWYVVIAWGIWIGGTLYQMLVIVPMWSAAPPESVQSFFIGTDYNRTIFNFFGPPFMAARLLPLLAALALAWHRPPHRRALLLAAISMAAATIFTVLYIYPINAVLFERAGGNGSSADIVAMVRRWIWADRLRFLVGAVAYAAMLRAFRLPLARPSAT